MAFPPLADLVFAYGRITLTVYVAQRGRDFYLILGCADPLGLTATKRPILWARAPKVRGARKWFKDHATLHELSFTFDR